MWCYFYYITMRCAVPKFTEIPTNLYYIYFVIMLIMGITDNFVCPIIVYLVLYNLTNRNVYKVVSQLSITEVY